MIRHFTNSVYVYNPMTKKFLFIHHKKLGKWLQPGGHWEENELSDESALREVLEETGIEVALVGERRPRNTDQIRPYGIQRNIIEAGAHEHLDLIYLAVPNGEQTLIRNDSETQGVKWVSLEEIISESFDTFEPQREWCEFFYNMMNETIERRPGCKDT